MFCRFCEIARNNPESGMSRKTKIGLIRTDGDSEIQWTIQNVFSYKTEDAGFDSPQFFISGSLWSLRIYPNGSTRSNSVGWIDLHLFREEDSSPPQGACFEFGLKKADGTVEKMENNAITWVFDERSRGFGRLKLLKRSQLLGQKYELAPLGVLRVTCRLFVYKDNESSITQDLDMLSHHFLDMFTSKRGCDATLKVKQEEIPVHKCVLSARSSVFAAMFKTDMKEKTTGVVEIVDFDPGDFKVFVKYLYSGKIEDFPSNAFQLYKIADKYDVQCLKPPCLIYFMQNLTVENVLDVAILAHQSSEISLEAKTSKFFNKNFSLIVSTAKWDYFLESNRLLANKLLKNLGFEMQMKKILL